MGRVIRSFIAIPLPEQTCDALERIQDELDVGRPTHAETFHITLAYLDKQTPQNLERIDEVLRQIRVPPFEITMSGVGVFGGAQPKAVWAGVAPSAELERLCAKVRRAASRSGVSLPRARFRPHVTLARLGKRLRHTDEAKLQRFLSAFGGVTFSTFDVTRFVLFRSTLHHTGALYDPMVEYRFDTDLTGP